MFIWGKTKTNFLYLKKPISNKGGKGKKILIKWNILDTKKWIKIFLDFKYTLASEVYFTRKLLAIKGGG